MKSGDYVPERGEIVWLNFEPSRGGEIQKKRPAVALSPRLYNKKSGLALFVPITSSQKGYPFEVCFEHPDVQGVILADQVKSFDWRARQARYVGAIKARVLEEVLEKAKLLFSV